MKDINESECSIRSESDQDLKKKYEILQRSNFNSTLMLEKLLVTSTVTKTIFKYLDSMRIKEVSIFGHNKIAAALWSALSNGNYKIKYLLAERDRELIATNPDYKILSFHHLKLAEKLKEHDVIIIASELSLSYHKRILSEVTNANLIFLTDLLDFDFKYQETLQPLFDFMSEKHGTKFMICNYPNMREIKNKSSHEQYLLEKNTHAGNIVKSPELYHDHLDPVFKPLNLDNQYIYEVTGNIELLNRNGINLRTDRTGKYINIINGHRITTDLPSDFQGTIYLVGNSLIFGRGVDDSNTLCSHLQRSINNLCAQNNTPSFAVMNCGNSNNNTKKRMNYLKSLPITEKDIVILFLPLKEFDLTVLQRTISCCNVQPAFERPHKMGEIFYDTSSHMNYIGYQAFAKALMNRMLELNILDSAALPEKASFTPKALQAGMDDDKQDPELLNYINYLHENKFRTGGKIGSIVMNCNPFTLGHRYLIEKASAAVDYLYIFVVEEDKSFFPFADRLDLVKSGTADLPNVAVFPSGKFIISSQTFAEYFEKETQSSISIDPSYDITMFATKIAPALNITTRFVGEEPLCNITRQYNATMKNILPQHGIDVVIIPRVESGGQPISASRVRQLLEKKDFDSISSIVPETTLNYLRKHYS